MIAKFKPNLKRLLEFVILGQFVVQQVGRCREEAGASAFAAAETTNHFNPTTSNA